MPDDEKTCDAEGAQKKEKKPRLTSRMVTIKTIELATMTVVLTLLLVIPSISFFSVKKPFVYVFAGLGGLLAGGGLLLWQKTKAYRVWLYNLSDFVFTFQIVLTVIILFFSFVLFPIQVVQTSMVPTLYSGERILASPAHKIERFDIVIAHLSKAQQELLGEEDTYIIKRVIGLPGDEISYDEHGLAINGIIYEEDYIFNGISGSAWRGKVPADSYFLMGDNRAVSVDSRRLGAFYSSQLIGIARYTFGWLYIRKVES